MAITSTAKRTKFKGNVIALPKVRLSFPTLFEPEPFEDGQEPKFRATFLLSPTDPVHRSVLGKIQAEIKRAIAEEWGTRPPKLKQEFFGKGNDCTNQTTGEIYDGYEGMYFIRANCKAEKPPLLRDKFKKPVEPFHKDFYAGVIVNATVNIWTQDDTKWGKRLGCNLRAVMSLGYGDPFGNMATDADFDDFDAADDDGFDGLDDGLDNGMENFEDDVPF